MGNIEQSIQQSLAEDARQARMSAIWGNAGVALLVMIEQTPAQFDGHWSLSYNHDDQAFAYTWTQSDGSILGIVNVSPQAMASKHPSLIAMEALSSLVEAADGIKKARLIDDGEIKATTDERRGANLGDPDGKPVSGDHH